MTIAYKEILNSQSMDRNDQSISARRRFVVYSEGDTVSTGPAPDDPITPSSAVDAIGIKIGDPFRAATDTPPGSVIEQGLKAVGYTVEASTQRRYTWNVTWDYQWGGGGGGPDPEGDYNATITMQPGAEWVDCWRKVLPEESQAVPFGIYNREYSVDSDIGGKAFDVGGEPLSCLVRKVNINVRQYVEDWNSAKLATMTSLVGFVNGLGGLFDVFDQGTVVYLGGSVRLVRGNDLVEIDHSFQFDEFYHLRQSAMRNSDGEVIILGRNIEKRAGVFVIVGQAPRNWPSLTATQQGILYARYANYAYPVHYVNPYPQISQNNFGDLGIDLGSSVGSATSTSFA